MLRGGKCARAAARIGGHLLRRRQPAGAALRAARSACRTHSAVDIRCWLASRRISLSSFASRTTCSRCYSI